MTNRLLLFCLFLLIPGLVSAEKKENFLKEVVVIEKAFDYEALKKPGFNTLITRDDIERSSAQSLFDIIEKESSVLIKSNTGSDKFSSIDLRGMGESASSNVLVILDDVVLNPADMSGQGINDIPLELIESVEIIRGSGVVLNGGGAVSGVIKVKLRKVKENKAFINFSLGTDKEIKKDIILTHKEKDQSLLMAASLYDTDGYRENSFYNKKTFDIKYSNLMVTSFEFGFNGAVFIDEYGLPGAVSINDLKDENKRIKSDFPFDEGKTTKKKGMIFVKKEFDLLGELFVSRSYEYKNNDYVLGYSKLIPKEDQENLISSVGKDLRISFEKSSDFFSYKTGLDWFFDDYVRDSKSESLRKNGQLDSKDIYFSSLIDLNRFNLNLGARYSKTDSKFREDLFLSGKETIGDKKDDKYSNFGFETGVNYKPFTNPFEFFFLVTKSFRNPNIDELALSTGNLHSQSSINAEVGTKLLQNNKFNGSISFFRHLTNDEIYYGIDENGGRFNKNYKDNTIRQGVDLRLDIYPLSSLFLRFTASVINAEFEDTKNEIPLVSNNQFSGFIEYEAIHDLFLSLQYSWFSKRNQGGDIEGKLKELPDYSVLNTSINYKKDKIKFYLRVDNLLNELYATTSYENSCYPMPEREIIAGVKLEF